MKRSLFSAWLGGLVLAAATSPLWAQGAFTLDGTGTRVAYSENPGTTAWALTPGFQLVQPWRSLNANATYAQFQDGSWSVRGQAAGSTFSPPVHGFRAELGGSLSGTIFQDQSRSGQYAGILRLHWLGSNVGGWIGGTAGKSWNGPGWLSTTRSEVGGWLRRGLVSYTLTISPTAIGEDIRFADVESAVQLSSGALELIGSGGLRHWTGTSAGSNTLWIMGSATYWVGGHIALVASAGTYPADYAQGLPGGTYGSLGLRVATRRPGVPTPKLGARLGLPKSGVEAPALELRRRSADSVAVTLLARAAQAVELMGDFTQWSPVPLTRLQGDRWTVTLPIPPGNHRMNVRIDGGAWDVPPGVPSLSDDFSGVVGLLVVE